MEESIYKLKDTQTRSAFRYGYLLGKMFPYIRPYIFRIFIGFLIAIPLGLLEGVTAFALKPYLDYAIGGATLDFTFLGHHFVITSAQMAIIIPAVVILFAVVQGILRYLNDYISVWSSQKITNDIKIELFHNLINMHPQFYDMNSSGVIIQRYMNDPQLASQGLVDQIRVVVTSVFGALGLIFVMLYSSWRLAIIGVVVLLVAFLPAAIIRRRLKNASNQIMVINGNLTTNINEAYNGNKVIASYELQDKQEDKFKRQVFDSFRVNISLTKRVSWLSPSMFMIASLGIATVLGYGTHLINSGIMTAGAFASFVTSLLLLYKPVKTLGNTLTNIQNIFVAMGRVFELFDLETLIKDCDNPKVISGLNNGISFNNVDFEYVEGTPVLKNFSLDVKKNETIAIVGNSGGGKSTLVNLIPRFYDIKSGSITIDGTDVRNISLKSLRSQIAMVFQDNYLFTGSVRENIMMGNPEASEEELQNAVKLANLEEFLTSLPDGIETIVGERGTSLSGGQRQRVAIARAIIKNSPIVILDEATSALDNESEAVVQAAMDNLMQNKTVFVIAHRLSTIHNADRIAVINEGELAELGTHDELIKKRNGKYKHLYEMQFAGG